MDFSNKAVDARSKYHMSLNLSICVTSSVFHVYDLTVVNKRLVLGPAAVFAVQIPYCIRRRSNSVEAPPLPTNSVCPQACGYSNAINTSGSNSPAHVLAGYVRPIRSVQRVGRRAPVPVLSRATIQSRNMSQFSCLRCDLSHSCQWMTVQPA